MSRLSDPERPPDTDAENRHAAERHYWNRQIVVQWAMVYVALLTFGAVAAYAYWAWQQVQVMDRTLEISERPWVSVDFEMLQPLRFDDKGASLSMELHLKNIGHSVASNITFREKLFPVNLTDLFKRIYSLPVNEELEMCKPTPWQQEMPIITGFRLFPNEEATPKDIARASKSDIARGNVWLNTPNATEPLNRIGIMLVGCIVYDSPFGHHHTGFLRVLGAQQPDGSVTVAIDPTIFGQHPDATLQQIPIGNSAN
jgi:hypothetical protein